MLQFMQSQAQDFTSGCAAAEKQVHRLLQG